MGRRLSPAICLFAVLSAAHADIVPPPDGYRPPVIAKVQIVFSVVSHHHHISNRISFYDRSGSPPGSTNYAVPMLVYEPLVTLYNPYHDTLTIEDGVRVRLWDPPVGFRFAKKGVWLRPAFAEGSYLGLSYFNILDQHAGLGRKTFTLHLTDGTPTAAGMDLALPPGASATYAMRLEPDWTWGYETASDYSPRSVFDWSPESDFTNIDNRTNNHLGVEAIRGWDPRAGFQTDHLSLSSGRPPETAYPFEVNDSYGKAGWVTTLLNDIFRVEAAPVRTASEPAAADFQVDLMAGRHGSSSPDVYQEFKFDLSSLVAHRDPTGTVPAAIKRDFLVDHLLQEPNDPTPGGKTSFAVLTAVAKATALADGSLTRLGTADAGDLYDFRFDGTPGNFELNYIGNLAPPPDAVEVLALKRHGGALSIDLLSPLPDDETWQAWGGESPDAIDEPLEDFAEVVPGPPGTPLRRVIIERPEWPERYFIQFRSEAP